MALFIQILVICWGLIASASVLELRLPAREEFKDRRNEFPYALLEAALAHHGVKAKLSLIPQTKGQGEQLKMLESDFPQKLDLAWMVANPTRASKYLLVKHSIYGPLIGVRLALVRKDKSNICSEVKNLESLRRFRIVQAKDWPDYSVLQENNLKVVAAKNYGEAFALLKAKKADIFLRGANEIVAEAHANSDDVQICPGWFVQYPQEVHFLVSPTKPEIHKSLQEALVAYSDTPAYKKLFATYFRKEVESLELKKRTSIRLKNSNALGFELDYSPDREMF